MQRYSQVPIRKEYSTISYDIKKLEFLVTHRLKLHGLSERLQLQRQNTNFAPVITRSNLPAPIFCAVYVLCVVISALAGSVIYVSTFCATEYDAFIKTLRQHLYVKNTPFQVNKFYYFTCLPKREYIKQLYTIFLYFQQ